MNPKRSSPTAIIDNLNYIENPFKQKLFTADTYTRNKNAGANTDFEFVLKFLYSYNGSTATFSSYRRELERLLQWPWNIEKMSLLNLKRKHIGVLGLIGARAKILEKKP